MNESQVFTNALKHAVPAERAVYLDEVCAGNSQLRAEVEALLQAHASDPGFLEPVGRRPAAEGSPPALPTADCPLPAGAEGPGMLIAGRYKLLEEIGAGGMGTVWLAQQTQPVKRLVAVKLIKPGMDSKQVLARFEAERQALALMDHPNIAKILDGGAWDEGRGTRQRGEGEGRGASQDPSPQANHPSPLAFRPSPLASRPYFVMELVKGVPITKYCDEQRLTPRQRLELFVPLCQAVQHAHQKGIIHRDLKPSNVMVTLHDGVPVVKVIDFGIAKATGGQLTDKTLFTGFAQMIGTPMYMSPEQASLSNLDVDTRSDIYSLGVLLYELLTGTTPFDKERFQQADYDEIRRIIREEEPPKPSTRLSELSSPHAPRAEPGSGTRSVPTTLASVAAQRQSDPKQLSRLFRGELDWIIMTCLDKERNRRYETASGLARDIECFLHDEPVQACPPSMAYRLRKFVRRNKRALATAGVVVLAVLLAVGALGWAVRDREARERDAARDQQARQAAIEQEVNLALHKAEELRSAGKWAEARGAIERAHALLASSQGGTPLRKRAESLSADLEMAAVLEGLYFGMSDMHDERSYLNRTLFDRAFAKAFRDYIMDVQTLSPQEAAERIRGRAIRVQLAAALDFWAMVRKLEMKAEDQSWKHLLAISRIADADALRNQMRDALEKGDHGVLTELAARDEAATWPVSTLNLLGNLLLKARAFEEAAIFLSQAQRQHPGDLEINTNLGHGLANTNPPQLDEALRFATAAVALRPSPGTYLNLGVLFRKKGLGKAAMDAYQQALRFKPDFALAHNNIGNVWVDKKEPDRAVAAYKEAIRLQPDHAQFHLNLGCVLADQGFRDDAAAAFRRTIELDPHDAKPHYNLGLGCNARGDLEAAIGHFLQAITLDPMDADAHCNLAINLKKVKGDLEGAIKHYRLAIAVRPKDSRLHYNLAIALKAKGDREGAIAEYRLAIRLDPKDTDSLVNLGAALAEKGDRDGAIDAYREALQIDPKHFFGHFNLGNALRAKKNLDGAIICYRQAAQLRPNDALAFHALGNALTDKGDQEGAFVAHRRAIQNGLKDATVHYNLGRVLKGKNRLDEAIAEYRNAIQLESQHGLAHGGLGEALLQQGHFAEACKASQRALDLLPAGDPVRKVAARHLQKGAVLLAVDKKLPAILQGAAQPKDAVERINLGCLCWQYKKRHAAAARFYAGAFDEQPQLAEDLRRPVRYDAARAAALAGCGRGIDSDNLDEQGRARWRQQALAWLRADLALWSKHLKSNTPAARVATQKMLQDWQRDRDLAGLREQAALDKLPDAERQAWAKLWADVAILFNQAAGDDHPGKLTLRLKQEDSLSANDPKDKVLGKSHHKIYPIKLEANRTYVIDMVSKEFDTYLRLEDAAGKQLAEDDDSGGNLNAGIIFTAPNTGIYRIIATSYQAATGRFTLTVHERDEANKAKEK